MKTGTLYVQIGSGYNTTRKADFLITEKLFQFLDPQPEADAINHSYSEDLSKRFIPAPFNFEIDSSAPVSTAFKAMKIKEFLSAADYIKQLLYGRNRKKNNPLSVLNEQIGTCSTKHALLKLLANENVQPGIRLMLGIFKMNPVNTPAIAGRLHRHKLRYIPEAHNYLIVNNQHCDYTSTKSAVGDFCNDLELEVEINADQIGKYKVSFHRSYLKDWLKREQR